MAKNLSLTGIQTGDAIEAKHVSQSIKAFTGAEAYDITISGSLTVQGSINGTAGVLNSLSSSYALTASHALNSSGGSSGVGTLQQVMESGSVTTLVITASAGISSSGAIISPSFTGSLSGSASEAISASFAQTASYVATAQTASYVLNAVSASFAQTASFIDDSAKFPFSGSAIITGSLVISSSNQDQSLKLFGSGSNIFSIEGSRGTLFKIDDNESDGILFSANNVSGTPVLEVHEDNTVKLGKQNGFGIVISGSNPLPNDSDAKILITGSIYHSGSIASFNSNISASGYISSSVINIGGGTFTSASLASAVAGEGETYDLNAGGDGNNIDLNLTSTSGTDNSVVQLTAGPNITLVTGSSAEIIISSSGGEGAGFPFSGSAEITGSLLVSQSFVNFTEATGVRGSFSGSFEGEGSGIIGVISSSYALSASFAISASHEIIKEVSSSHADTADTASYVENAQTASFISPTFISASAAASGFGGSVLTSSYTSEWVLGASGIDHYTFTGPGLTGAENDPDIYLVRGQKYRFYNNSGGHPFRIQSTPNGSAGTQYNDGVTNNDANNGEYLLFDVQFDAPTKLYYQCTNHSDMGGPIYIADAIVHSGSFSGSFQGNGSDITGIISSSYALSASFAISASHEIIKEVSSSHADTADTASYVETAQTASYVLTAQTASFVTLAQTASYVTTAQTSSYVLASNIDQPFINITASGNISASGHISASSFNATPGTINELTASYAITASIAEGILPTINFKPVVTHTSNFNSETSYAGRYNIVGGTLAITIQTSSYNLTPGMEWDFFQTSSGDNFTFTAGTGVNLLSRNMHTKLAAIGSAATLKYISDQTFHLIGDLTL